MDAPEKQRRRNELVRASAASCQLLQRDILAAIGGIAGGAVFQPTTVLCGCVLFEVVNSWEFPKRLTDFINLVRHGMLPTAISALAGL